MLVKIHSDNSETGEVDEVLTTHEDDTTLYQEQKQITAKAFLETVAENDLIFSAVIKGFCDSYNVDDEKFGQAVPDNVQNAVMLAFNQTISLDHLEKLPERTNLPDNYRSTDIKLTDIKKDYSKVSPCLIQLLARLPDVLRNMPR